MRRKDTYYQSLIGTKYGKLTVLSILPESNEDKRKMALCQCDCAANTIKNVLIKTLLNGGAKSCGCIRDELTKQTGLNNATHGLSKHPIFILWDRIQARCYNKNWDNYKDYGGRGITVCDEWRKDFTSFYNWCINNGWTNKLKIDRRNNNGNYEPDNCRFVTHKENSRNTRYNVLITHNNQTKCIAEWAEIYNIQYNKLYYQLKKGLSLENITITFNNH